MLPCVILDVAMDLDVGCKIRAGDTLDTGLNLIQSHDAVLIEFLIMTWHFRSALLNIYLTNPINPGHQC